MPSDRFAAILLPFSAQSNFATLKPASLVSWGLDPMPGMICLVSLARLTVPRNQPDLARVYDGIRIAKEGKQVRLSIAVPEADAERFLDTWVGAASH